MNETCTIGKHKLENIETLSGGREQAKVYRLTTDEHGRKSWVHAGRVVRQNYESWGESIDRFEASE